MPMAKEYQHFCPVARSLEVIGEKWSLLLVRDLLRGPQRFSDLQRYMGGITPKWLTQRLRDLEAAGIVERDSEPGRREVWYRLTEKGRALRPVVESMIVWGVEHAMRPPRDGEPVFPESVMAAMTTMMRHRGTRAKMPVAWRFVFEERTILLTFDSERWRVNDDDGAAAADLEVRVNARAWVTLLATPPDARGAFLRAIDVSGDPSHVAEFRRIFSADISKAQPAARNRRPAAAASRR